MNKKMLLFCLLACSFNQMNSVGGVLVGVGAGAAMGGTAAMYACTRPVIVRAMHVYHKMPSIKILFQNAWNGVKNYKFLWSKKQFQLPVSGEYGTMSSTESFTFASGKMKERFGRMFKYPRPKIESGPIHIGIGQSVAQIGSKSAKQSVHGKGASTGSNAAFSERITKQDLAGSYNLGSGNGYFKGFTEGAEQGSKTGFNKGLVLGTAGGGILAWEQRKKKKVLEQELKNIEEQKQKLLAELELSKEFQIQQDVARESFDGSKQPCLV